MAKAKTPSPETPSPESTPVDSALVDEQLMHDTEAERLKAERDAITKRLRALNKKAPAAKPTATLVEVEAKQSEFPQIYPIDALTRLCAARCRAGASEALAVEGVIALYRPLVEAALAEHRVTGDEIETVTARMLGRTRGHRGSKAAQ